MAKRQSTWSDVLKGVPTLLQKAVEYLDTQTERVANAEAETVSGPGLDRVYRSQLEKSLPNIALAEQERREDLIRRKSFTKEFMIPDGEYGYRDKNSHVTFEMLHRMAFSDAIVGAILMTRVNQLANFSRPLRERTGMGYQITLKDQTEEITEEDTATICELEEWLLFCGYKDDRAPSEVMNFEEFLRRVISDRLIYDAITIECIPCEDETLHHFVPVSSGTIRFASRHLHYGKNMLMVPDSLWGEHPDPNREEHDLEIADEDIEFVQVWKGQMMTGFSRDELIYKQANPTNEPWTNGYSIPELERLIRVISSHLLSETHNRQFFTGGVGAQGIIHFKADLPKDQVDAFRRAWETQVTGSQNSFRTPIIATDEDVSWLPMQMNNREMEWSKWMEYLIKLICAMYQIDPAEIGFWTLSSGSNSLGDGNKNERILKQSKDKGLRPLLRLIESIVNDEIFPRLDPEICDRFEFRFVGLDTEEKRDEMERHQIEVQTKKTVNQVRREMGDPPLPHMDGFILNPIFFAWWAQFSPEATELRVKNAFFEQVMVHKYQDQLRSILGDPDATLEVPASTVGRDDEIELPGGSGTGGMTVKSLSSMREGTVAIEYLPMGDG